MVQTYCEMVTCFRLKLQMHNVSRKELNVAILSSLIYCCTVSVYGDFFLSFVLTFCSLSANEITADSVHELARALEVNQNLQRLK